MVSTTTTVVVSDGMCKGQRAIICEDHPPTRLGLHETCLKLGCEVVGETAFGAEAIELVERYQPDLLILDQYLPDGVDGPIVHQETRLRSSKTKVLVITSYCDSASFFDWVNQADGPDGVLPKTSSMYQIRAAIVQLLTTGAKYIPDSIWNHEQADPRNPLNKLTRSELKVLRDIAQGFSLTDIAKRQNLALSTVRSYMNQIYAKLELPSNTLHGAAAVYNKWVNIGHTAVDR